VKKKMQGIPPLQRKLKFRVIIMAVVLAVLVAAVVMVSVMMVSVVFPVSGCGSDVGGWWHWWWGVVAVVVTATAVKSNQMLDISGEK
jgi:hypothetical protein